MIYSISINSLKAAHFCSATKDVRYYLNGVYLDFKVDNVTPHVNIVATDGCLLAAYQDKLRDENRGNDGDDFGLIIPLDTIKTVLKLVGKNQKTIGLENMGDNWRLGDLNFVPVDGKFPDYNRAIPDSSKCHFTGDGPRLDPELVLKAQKSLNTRFNWSINAKGKGSLTYGPTKKDPVVLHNGDNKSLVVIMPMKNDELVYFGFSA